MADDFTRLDGHIRVLIERAQQSVSELERERGYILESMEKAQRMFSDQPYGQELITTLYEVINRLAAADSSLYSLQSRANQYLEQIRR